MVEQLSLKGIGLSQKKRVSLYGWLFMTEATYRYYAPWRIQGFILRKAAPRMEIRITPVTLKIFGSDFY